MAINKETLAMALSYVEKGLAAKTKASARQNFMLAKGLLEDAKPKRKTRTFRQLFTGCEVCGYVGLPGEVDCPRCKGNLLSFRVTLAQSTYDKMTPDGRRVLKVEMECTKTLSEMGYFKGSI